MTSGENRYLDTRANMDDTLSFSEAIVKGLAQGGGLLVPERIPDLNLDEIVSLAGLPYSKRAAFIYKKFATDFTDDDVDKLMDIAYGDNFDDERIAPITKVGDNFVLELWHGPTSAFKDMALQCLPVFFSKAIEILRGRGQAKEDFLILVATSGDTGKAALEGFKDRDHTKIMVFYPHGGVSDIQFKQMATQLGSNVYVLGGRGDFDDCQTSVKQTFNDAEFSKKLAEEHNVRLSSANSINWGRLLPQIVYYVSSYSQMVADGAVKAGDPIEVCVPTGNFGNILAAYYAKCMGTPISRLICASNENRVLTDFIETGVYDIRDRQLVLTPSPSMDILVSSNLERQLFELTDRDAARVKGWMASLSSKGMFEVDPETKRRVQELFIAGSATNDESLQTIKRVYDEHGYLMDPHTAVAWTVCERIEHKDPLLIASTAHWAKFGPNVYRALNEIPAGNDLPEDVSKLTGAALNSLISEKTGGSPVPRGLSVLDEMELRFTDVCDATKEGVEKSVLDFLS
ncbi:MAG: threonine synthase [Coriobacteriales bacterium]|jgi:threonine synthase